METNTQDNLNLASQSTEMLPQEKEEIEILQNKLTIEEPKVETQKERIQKKIERIKRAQKNKSEDDKAASMTYYWMADGSRITKKQLLQRASQFSGTDRIEFFKREIKSKEVVSLKGDEFLFKRPYYPPYINNEYFDARLVSELIREQFGGEPYYDEKAKQANVGVTVTKHPIQIPTMRDYSYSLPYENGSRGLAEMKQVLDAFNYSYIMVFALNKDGNKMSINKIIPKHEITDENGFSRTIEKEVKIMYLYRFKFNFPYPDFQELSNRTIPVYNFVFSTIMMEKNFLKTFEQMLINGKFGDAEETKEATKEYNLLNKFAREHYFGNGTLKGMLNRIRIMSQYRNLYMKQRKKLDAKQKAKLTNEMVDHFGVFPFKPPSLNTIDTLKVDENPYYAYDHSVGRMVKTPFVRNMNLSASTGCWYTNVKIMNAEEEPVSLKRLNIIPVEPTIVFDMLRELGKPAYDPNNNNFNDPTKTYSKKSFDAKFESIKLVNLFPKAEVYELKQREEKTRCIATFNSASQTPIQQLLQPVLDNMKNAVNNPIFFEYKNGKLRNTDDKLQGTLLLAKQSLFKGNMQKVIKLIEHAIDNFEINDTWFGVYADNLYYLTKIDEFDVRWVSLDGVKAESAIDEELIRIANNVAMSISNKHGNQIITSYQRYFTEIFPELAASPKALIANQQINYPAMGSGVQGTYFYNCCKMTQNVLGATKISEPLMDGDDQFSTQFRQEMNDNGYQLTIEYCEHFYKSETSNIPWKDYLNLDLLGFNAAKFYITPTTSVYMSVLRYNSLAGLILFRKDHYNERGKTKLNTLEESYYQYIRMYTAIMVGSWYYPGLYAVCIKQCVRHHNVILRYKDTLELEGDALEEILDDMFRSDPLLLTTVDTLKSLLYKPNLPTIYTMVKLHTNDSNLAELAAKARLDELPLHLLAPIKILENWKEYTEEKYISEFEIPHGKLSKAYPRMKSGAISFMKENERSQGTPLGTHKADTSTYKKKIEVVSTTRKEPNKDVGPPKKTPKALYKVRDEQKYSAFVQWFNSMMQKGSIDYRVPIPLSYVGSEDEIINEKVVGRKAVVAAIINLTGYPESEIYPLIRQLPTNWKVKPVPRKENEEETFENTNRVLVHSRVINRAYED